MRPSGGAGRRPGRRPSGAQPGERVVRLWTVDIEAAADHRSGEQSGETSLPSGRRSRLPAVGSAAQLLADLFVRAGDDELVNPTPCPAYTLGDLIDHVGGLALAFAAAANKDRGTYADQEPFEDASRLGEDWRTRIPRDLGTLAEAWRKPDAWTGMTRIAGGDAPAAMVGLSLADELVVHGWDVARATG